MSRIAYVGGSQPAHKDIQVALWEAHTEEKLGPLARSQPQPQDGSPSFGGLSA